MKITENTLICRKQNKDTIINCGNSVEHERRRNGQSDSRMIEKDNINTNEPTGGMLEGILSRDNMNEAYQKVKRNKGAGGVDKMEMDELLEHLKTHREEVLTSLLKGSYKPYPVKRVEIPKENGKRRKLGIPTLRDRVVQQAILQVLSPIYEKQFSETSYGFRPNRGCHDALRKCQEYANQGYWYAIDIDLEKFFDTVNQSMLMEILSRTIKDNRVLSLIQKFLNAGIRGGLKMENADYVRYLIRNNESIYIDTASLMDVCELELFISNIRNVLLSSNRKIIVPRAVCLELTKHLGSNSVDKREKALRAMSLLSTHSDLFDLDNDNLQESEVYKAFADSELLAKMTVNMKFVGQLLITNDKRLSQDAFDLNNLASCRGHKIMVCYINRSGELHMCECVRDINHQPLRVATDHNFYNQECSNTNHVEEKSDESKDYDSKYFTAKSLFIPVSMLLISIITKKYSRSTYRIIKSLF